jgi:hypothetical protein
LEEFCTKDVVQSELVQRRTVARLMADMHGALMKLSQLLDLNSRRSRPTWKALSDDEANGIA